MRKHLPFIIIVGWYLCLSLIYNGVSPIFEAPDEATHFRYVKYLLDHKALPAIIDGPNRDELWGLHQPPLYFMLSAMLAAPFDLVAPDDFLQRNPHINLGFAQRPGNKNFYVHTSAEAFPYRGFPLVVRYLRLLSTLCGTVTLTFVYAIGGLLFKQEPALALIAPTLMTLHPEFVFINAAIANEPLNILLMAAGLWGCVRLILSGPSFKLAIFLGITAGLISIAKMTGLALTLLIVWAMLIAALQGRSALKLWQFGCIVAILQMVVGGWWYLRNWAIYGDPWQASMYRNFYGDVQQMITLPGWYRSILAGEVSFWATFGWFNVLVPEWIYQFYKTFLRFGLLGLLVFFLGASLKRMRLPIIRRLNDLLIPFKGRFFQMPCAARYLGPSMTGSMAPPTPQRGEKSGKVPPFGALGGLVLHRIYGYIVPSSLPCPSAPVFLLLASPLVSSLVLTRLIATEGGIQGRQLLPMLPALALLLVVGYQALLPRRFFWGGIMGIGLVLAGLVTAIPFFYIGTTYAAPPQFTETTLPNSMIPLVRNYDGQIRLLGYSLSSETVVPGRLDTITLYWQALQPIDSDYTLFVHALGRGGQKVGEYNGYPGQGNFPTSQWPVGPIIEDRVEFYIDPRATVPTLLQLHVGFFDFERLDLPPLAVIDADSNLISPIVAQQVLENDAVSITSPLLREIEREILDSQMPPGCHSLDITFVDQIKLTCYMLSDDQAMPTLALHWQATGSPEQDYTVFIQLWRDGQQAAGFDGPTLDGDFPSRYWRPTHRLVDEHTLDLEQLSPGLYRLLVGLYNAQTGERLPAFDVHGEALPAFAVDLGVVTIEQ